MTTHGGPSRGRTAVALLRAAASATVIVVLFYLVPLRAAVDGGTLVRLVVGLAVLAALLTWQIRAIARSPYPTLRAVEALAIAIPLFLVLFAATYVVMAEARATAFTQPLSRTDALYFTVAVFATVGFGDISPASQAARVVVTVQMVADLLLLGLVLRAVLDAVQRGHGRLSSERAE